MNNTEGKVKISVDLMGGDNSPEKTLEGIDLFVKRYKNKNDYFFYLFGDLNKVNAKIKKLKHLKTNYKLIDTKIVVSNELSAMSALKKGKGSSMWESIQSQISLNSDVTLSAGNTGVFLVMSKMILKMLEGIDKPALAGLWPSENGMNLVLDLGANVECGEKNIIDFSEMGSALYRSLFSDQEPKVSLLNIGSEELKGNDIIKETYQKLNQNINKNFDFKGFIEGNQIMDGNINVVVADGFTGNVALKTAEGTANFITNELRQSMKGSLLGRLGSLISINSLKKFKKKLDPRLYKGAILLGLDSPVIKSHGGTDYIGFANSLSVCEKIVKNNLIDKIKNSIN